MRRARILRIALVLVASGLMGACSDLFCDPETSITCDDEECTPAPSNCQSVAPTLHIVQLEVSSPRPVLVKVYRGSNHETGTEIWSGLAPGATWTLGAMTGPYSATALYVTDADSVLVVDGGVLEASSMETCDGSCFTQGSLDLDLRLQ